MLRKRRRHFALERCCRCDVAVVVVTSQVDRLSHLLLLLLLLLHHHRLHLLLAPLVLQLQLLLLLLQGTLRNGQAGLLMLRQLHAVRHQGGVTWPTRRQPLEPHCRLELQRLLGQMLLLLLLLLLHHAADRRHV